MAKLEGLSGKTIIVTGAGTAEGVGNGQAVALVAAREGANVVCVDLVAERAEATAASLREQGHSAVGVSADVTNADDCARFAETAMTEFGTIDGLVNNVGIVSRNGLAPRVDSGVLGELEDLDLDDWRQVFDTNVTSAMLSIRACLPSLRVAGGSIVNVGSTMAYRWYGGGGALAYSTAKSALEGLTLAMAGALGPYNIRVNLLVIGQVRAPHIDRAAIAMGKDGDAFLEGRRMSGLLQTEGTPWHVADAASFLLGPQSRWTSAQTLFVDAGANKTMR